jgi:3-methylcrotonyl-CoA carboxylase alpha subunit
VLGDIATGLIERERALLFRSDDVVPDEVWLLAALTEALREQRAADRSAEQAADRGSPWRILDGWRLNSHGRRRIRLRAALDPITEVREIGVEAIAGGHYLTLSAGRVFARGTLGADSEIQVQLGERRLRAAVVAAGERRQVFFEGRSWPLVLVDALYVGGGGDELAGGLRAPMPGKVVALLARPGDRVERGAPLLVLEAMKMEHTISAPSAGILKAYHFAAGDQVTDGAELLDFEAEASA